MPLQITMNPRPAGNLSIAENARARFSSVVSLPWDAVTDKPAVVATTGNPVTGNIAVFTADDNIEDGGASIPAAGIQPLDADLTAIAALSPSNDDIVQRKSGVWTNRTAAQFAADLSSGGLVRERLTANRTYYVRTDGSNSNTGLANTAGGAFLTIQYAINWIGQRLDLNGYNCTIQVADGTWTENLNLVPYVGRSGQGHTGPVVIRGNSGAATNVIFAPASGTAVTSVECGQFEWIFEYIKFAPATGASLLADLGGWIVCGPGVSFGATTNNHCVAEYGGIIEFTADYTISGGASSHLFNVHGGRIIYTGGQTVTLTGTPAFSGGFVSATGISEVIAPSVTFSGAATGTRWTRDAGSLFYLGGANPDSVFPGNANGSVATPWAVTEGGTGRATIEPQLSGATGLVNGKLVASVSSNALTIAVKTYAGNDPSSTDPVYAVFRNSTLATGDYTVLTLTAATSVVVSSGSTLGTANGVPNRIWVVGFNDAGTFRLGVINCLVGGASPTQIVGLNEYEVKSSTAEGGAGAADTAGIFYTGTAVSSKAFRILGFVESTQATAGTWATSPSLIQLFGPGVRKPGDIVQSVYSSSATVTTTTSSTFQTSNLSLSITPTSAANLVKVNAGGMSRTDSAATVAETRIHRGSTAIGDLGQFYPGTASGWGKVQMFAFDAPGTTSSTTYAVKVRSTDNANSVSYLAGDGGLGKTGTIYAEEIMV